jgi:proteasome lid subunit RPN8/RPN11
MTDTFTDHGALATWSTPQCHFTIEYSRKALDDIRLGVVDAFFSLPRGGAEIGGLLLGRFDEHRVQILDYAPIECEHASGPGFTLSPTDQARLGELLGQTFPGGLRPVGWYHSHTRSEIALSEDDLEIQNRYFPERWQVALVLRPSTLQPTQAGFFFREPDGSIHAENSYQEFVVEALPLHQVPVGGPQAAPGRMRETEPGAVVLTLPAAVAPVPELSQDGERAAPIAPAEPVAHYGYQPEHNAPPAEEPVVFQAPQPELSAPPRAAETLFEEPRREEPAVDFGHEAPRAEHQFSYPVEEAQGSRPRWLGIAAGLAAGLVLGLLAGRAGAHSASADQPAVTRRQAPDPDTAALRKKYDDLARQVADLTQQNGALRKENGELTKQQAEVSKQQAEVTRQQGEAGKQQSDLRQQRDDLAKQAAKLKADLSVQTLRAQSLQQQLDDLRRQQQRRRLSIQSSDPLP